MRLKTFFHHSNIPSARMFWLFCAMLFTFAKYDYLFLCFFLGRFRQVMQSIFAAISASIYPGTHRHIMHSLDVNGNRPWIALPTDIDFQYFQLFIEMFVRQTSHLARHVLTTNLEIRAIFLKLRSFQWSKSQLGNCRLIQTGEVGQWHDCRTRRRLRADAFIR